MARWPITILRFSGARALHEYACSPHHFRIENNLFVGPAQLPGYAVEWGGPIDDGLFDYNGYFSDGVFVFNFLGLGYRVFPNFTAAQNGGLKTHGRLLSQPIFASGSDRRPLLRHFYGAARCHSGFYFECIGSRLGFAQC